MVKKNIVFINLILLMLCIHLMPNTVSAADDHQYIYDDAHVLTESEIDQLSKVAAEYSERNQMDFIFLSIDDSAKDITDYMSDFYDDQAPGYEGEHGSVAILALNMATRDVQVAGFGLAEEKIDDTKMEALREQITPELSDGDYGDAFQTFMAKGEDYTRYRKNINPESFLYKTTTHLVLAVVIGFMVVYAMSRNMGTKVTVNSRTYQNEADTIVHGRRDRYIRTAVTRKRKPKPQNKSGGGRGGGMTGGGRSFSGSRGKF